MAIFSSEELDKISLLSQLIFEVWTGTFVFEQTDPLWTGLFLITMIPDDIAV